MFQNNWFPICPVPAKSTFQRIFGRAKCVFNICPYRLPKRVCLFCITSCLSVCLATFLIFTFISIFLFVFLSTCQFCRVSACLSVNKEAYLLFLMLVKQIVWLSSGVRKLYQRCCYLLEAVVHLELQISYWIFGKDNQGTGGCFLKNRWSKISCHGPFNYRSQHCAIAFRDFCWGVTPCLHSSRTVGSQRVTVSCVGWNLEIGYYREACQDPGNLNRIASPLVRTSYSWSGEHQFETPWRDRIGALTGD